MMRRSAGCTAAGIGLLVGLCWPAPASAQWYVGTYTGANHTRPASVVVDQPDTRSSLTFHDVTFDARPFTSPQYYGARIGRLFERGHLGVEVEFLHIKVISKTDRAVRVTGSSPAGRVDTMLRMDTIVQRYAMSHGLNFWLGNLVWRQPIGGNGGGGPVTAVLRAGLGPVVPGVDSVVNHVSVQGYQYAGLGGQVSAGVDVHLFGRWSATGEYKLTRTRPLLDVASGTGQTTALTHHVAFGFAFGFTRP